ncbi:MAG: hypothetical protein WBA41_05075 [Rivularia sp. (in: cyanobacteria)]
MIRRLALTAGFAILGAVAFAPKAHGQAAPDTETVTFSGEVTSSCSFDRDKTASGTLALENEGKTLSSVGSGSGGTTIVCTGPGGTISVAEPMKGELTPAGDFDVTATVSSGNGEQATSKDLTSFEIPINTEVPLTVDMTVTHTEALPAGDYSYDVVVTAKPN